MRKSKAFTLVELMVVVVIVGIFATLAYPMFSKTMTQARIRDAARQLSAMHAAVLIYRAQNGQFYESSGWLSLASFNTEHDTNFTAESGMTYFYVTTGSPPTAFTAGAIWNEGLSDEWRVEVSEAALDTNNPCCRSGGCTIALPSC